MAGYRRFWLAGLILASSLAATSSITSAAVLPTGFTETRLASGITGPTSMDIAPDGRIFVAEQRGRVLVIKNGTLLATPFLDLTAVVDSFSERGMLGVVVDPNFATNHFVYVYYTVRTPSVNRLSRVTANGDVATPGSEVVLLDNVGAANIHNGGSLHFGKDGNLYVGVGDAAVSTNAQTLANLHGKLLRFNADGSIPTDNPYYTTASGVNRAIWAIGLRSPFTFAVQPGTGRLFINDVGLDSWEEINDGIAGSNYGWPNTEGPTTNPIYRSPLLAYAHGGDSSVNGCAITGGTFYNPATPQFPSAYVGRYFFNDYCSNWTHTYDPVAGRWDPFASGIVQPVDLDVGADGSLYYLMMGGGTSTGAVYRITYTASQAPAITSHPAHQTVPVGAAATFTVAASGTAPLSYQWQRNGATITGATAASYTVASATLADSGATFRAIVTNAFGTATSSAATLTVTSNTSPTGTITAPAGGTLYNGGDTISYAGSATDTEDGSLPASAFTWWVDFHHDTHTHPFRPPTSGSKSGSFVVPNNDHTAANVWFRVYLTVEDSGGLTHTSFVDVRPRTVTLTLGTVPAGLQVTLDGVPQTTPASVVSVVGVLRALGVVSPQTAGGTTYTFSSWSDAGAATHTIATPSSNSTYTATYGVAPASAALVAAYGFSEGSGSQIADASGNGNTGVISGAAWTTGRSGAGSALAFNGSSSWVTINDSAALDFTAGMTLEAWVYPTRNTDWQGVLVKERAGSPSVYGLFATTGPNPAPSGKVYLTNGANERVYGTTVLALNTWTHLATTYDGSTLRLYVNGGLVGSRGVVGSILTSSGPVRLGGNAVFGEFFQGRIDDVRLYSRALTQGEVQADLNTPVGGPPPSPTGPVAAYGFNEGSGSQIADASGNGHTGIMSGAAWTTGRSGAGSALAFNGSSSWVTINDSAALDFTAGMTLEAWVYPTRNTDWQGVLVKERAGSPSVYGLFATTGPNSAPSGKVYLTNGANERVYGTTGLALNTWTHLATTYDGSTLRLYVDGGLVGSRGVVGSILTSSGPLRLGGDAVFGEFFQGRIDDVRLYSRTLTQGEIQADMTAPVSP